MEKWDDANLIPVSVLASWGFEDWVYNGREFSCRSPNACRFQACNIAFVGDAHISIPVPWTQFYCPSLGRTFGDLAIRRPMPSLAAMPTPLMQNPFDNHDRSAFGLPASCIR